MGMQTRVRKDQDKKRKGVHPIWRGIGCILIFVVLVMSYAGASIFVDSNRDNQWVTFPEVVQVGPAWAPDLYMKLLVGFFFALLGFGIFVIVYSLIYSAGSPPDIMERW